MAHGEDVHSKDEPSEISKIADQFSSRLDDYVASSPMKVEELAKQANDLIEERNSLVNQLGDIDESDSVRIEEIEQRIRALDRQIDDIEQDVKGSRGVFGHEYQRTMLESLTNQVQRDYIEGVYRLNPDYFKNLPTGEFMVIADKLVDIQRRIGITAGISSEGLHLLIMRRIGTIIESGKQYTTDEIQSIIQDHLDNEEVEYILSQNVDTSVMDQRAFDLPRTLGAIDGEFLSAEDRTMIENIVPGFLDRPPRETYRMYAEAVDKIYDASKKQLAKLKNDEEMTIADIRSRSSVSESNQ